MDKLSELSHGAKVVLGAAIALLIVSFFDWFQYADIGFANMWNGIGVVAGLREQGERGVLAVAELGRRANRSLRQLRPDDSRRC